MTNGIFTEKREMIVFPRAKINIGLFITEKRADGYHNIETLFYPVGLSDALEFVVNDADSDELEVTGMNNIGSTGDNLVIKAVRLLRERYGIPHLRIHLHKAIPAGAGLGGGSSDASCMLKAAARHFATGAGNEILKELALSLGSDCPFFIDGVPAFAGGRGEILTPAPPLLSGLYLVLVNPGIEAATSEAYKNCKPSQPGFRIGDLATVPVAEWKNVLRNDFEEYVFLKHPLIGDLKSALNGEGSLYSSMSGSGSSVYGIFAAKPSIAPELRKYVLWEGFMQ